MGEFVYEFECDDKTIGALFGGGGGGYALPLSVLLLFPVARSVSSKWIRPVLRCDETSR